MPSCRVLKPRQPISLNLGIPKVLDMNKLLTLTIAFFFISTYPVFAFTEYSGNSYIDSSITDFAYYSYPNMTLAYNATCSGHSGCLGVISYGNDTPNYIAIWPLASDNLTDIISVPANRELIVSFSYRLNNTITTPSPFIQLTDSVNTTNITTLNATPNVWHNYTIIYAAKNQTIRYSMPFIKFSFDTVPTELWLTKFKVYTLDTVDSASSGYWSTEPAVLERYCGTGYTNISDWNSASRYKTTGLNGVARAYDKEGLDCWVFKLGNFTLVRRSTGHTGNLASDTYPTWTFRDLYFINYASAYNAGTGAVTWQYRILATKLSLLSGEFTLISNETIGSTHSITTNGTPATNYNLSQAANSILLTLRGELNRQTLNLSLYTTTAAPSGTGWSINHDSDSVKSFFSFNPILCSPGYTYDPNTNYQYYIEANCSISETTYCGVCGGNVTSGVCASNDFYSGAICTSGTAYSVYSLNDICEQVNTSGTCDSGLSCMLHAASKAIECFDNRTGEHTYCINSTGSRVECSTLTGSTFPVLCLVSGGWGNCPTDAYSQLSLAFLGSMSRDPDTTNTVLSLIISLIITLIFAIVARNSEDYLPYIILIVFVASISIFALLSYFNPIIWVLLSILDIFLLYSIYKDISGGGG